MTPNWDDMRSFLAVARAETLSAAASLLKADPATIGRRVARLEEALDEVLFVKSAQGYRLTAQGQKLLSHAVRFEQTMLDAREDLGGQGSELSGQIRLGAPDGCANFLLPQVCAAITAENPDLDIQIVALPRIFNLSKREADMAITVSRPEAGRLLVQKLADYRLHLAAAEDYLAKHSPISSMADLSHHSFIGYIPDMIFDKELDYLSGTPFERVRLASNSASVQLNAMRQGGGVGVVHDFALPAAPNLRKILPDVFSLKRSFYLIRHEDDRRVARLSRFAESLSEGIRRELVRLEALA